MGTDCIVGHIKQIQDICNILKNQKTNRTFLFSGKSGIGKKKIAMEMSKFILGEQVLQEYILCYERDIVSDMMNKGMHPDFVFISTYDEDISINTYRDFVIKIFKKPIIKKKKVLLIDGIERLNKNVFNAMLKTFEEPPIDTTIILISSDISNIPGTLISRCTHLHFQPLDSTEIQAVIKNFKYQYKDIDIDKIIEISDGSIDIIEYIVQNDFVDVYREFEDIFNLVQKKQKEQALQKFLKMYESRKLKDHTKIVRLFFIKFIQRLLQTSNPSNIHRIVTTLSYAENLQLDMKTIVSSAIESLANC